MALEFSFAFPLPNGLHARPASCLEDAVSRFASRVLLVNHRNGRSGDARSILSLVGTDCKFEDACSLRVEGDDEREALDALRAYMTETFPHCDDALPEIAPAPSENRLPRSLRGESFRFLRGVPVSPGIGRGRIVILGTGNSTLRIPETDAVDPVRETARIDNGLRALEERIESKLSRAGKGVQAQILRAHRSIARDRELRTNLRERVAQGRSAAEAVAGAVESVSESLRASENPLLRERALDVRDIGQQLLEEMYGDAVRPPKTVLTADSICVAESLTPSQFLALDRERLRGIALGDRGATSHAIILARSFGVPVVAGVDLGGVESAAGRDAILDAFAGLLAIDPPPRVERYYRREMTRLDRRRERLLASSATERPATADGRVLGVAANVSSPAELDNPAFSAAEGVGLFRTEMIFLDRDAPPDEEEQLDLYQSILEKAGDRPVTIRTLDVGGDKPLPYLHLPTEANPFLGYRAVRLYPEFRAVFAAQLRALLRASVRGRLRILIPMVSCVEEILWVKEQIAGARKECDARGFGVAESIPLGMMLEVPSAAFLIDRFSREVDFFSLGTNDLSQYFMAADRENERVAHLFTPLQPAFLRFLNQIVEAIHREGKRAGVCGEMAGSIEALPLLVGLGFDDLSLSIPKLMDVRATLRTLDSVACRDVADAALRCDTVADVKALLAKSRGTAAALPLLERDLIHVSADCRSREEVLKEMVDALFVAGRTADPSRVEEDLWRREDVYSTGLGHGFAIPHCKSPAMTANSIALLKLDEPVEWNSSDGKPVDVAILLAMGDTDADNTHMKVFARLARKIMHESFRNALREENDPDRLLHFLKNALELE